MRLRLAGWVTNFAGDMELLNFASGREHLNFAVSPRVLRP